MVGRGSGDVLPHQLLEVVHHGRFLSPATTSSSRDASSNIARSDVERTRGLALDGALAAAQRGGGLADVELLEVPQHHARALPLRQPGERGHQRRPVGDGRGDVLAGGAVGVLGRGSLGARPLAAGVQERADHRLAGVGELAAVPDQPRPGDVHPDQTLLHVVGGAVPVTAQQVRRAAQPGPARGRELGEGGIRGRISPHALLNDVSRGSVARASVLSDRSK